jgi:hypothetical protein
MPETAPKEYEGDQADKISRLQKLSRLLDDAVRIPGSNFRIGLDPLLGLIPGSGDLIGGLLSTYIVIEAARMGVPKSTLGRMGTNILWELGLGVIPLLGDLFDVTWKANVRNVELLQKHVQAPSRERAVNRWLVVGLIVLMLFLMVATTALSVWLVRWIFLQVGGAS